MSARGPNSSARAFLSGGGNMGRLTRAFNWSVTSIGNPDAWPQSLRTAVRLILNTNHPAFLFWGKELLCFYNDAYSRSIGPERHPSALGQPGQLVWEEIWDIIGPQIEQVMAGRGATWHENQLVPITRHGKREDVYWTYSFGPVDDEVAPNGVGGVLVLCTETTPQIIGAREREEEIKRLDRMFAQAPGPLAVLRGPKHVYEIVNPAFSRLVGDRPLLGKTVADALPEVIGQGFIELLDGVYQTGTPHVGHRTPASLPGQGDGPLEDHLLDFVYEPLRDAAGEVTGIFVQVTDITDYVRVEDELRSREQRQSFLLRLENELRQAQAASQIMALAAEALGRELGADRCGYGEIKEGLSVVECDWTNGVMPSVVGRYNLADFAGEFQAEYQARRAVRINDTLDDPRIAAGKRDAYLHLGGMRAALGVPLVQDGDYVAVLFVHSQVPRRWSDADETLAREVAERTWEAIERVRSQAALRASEEQLRLAIDAAEIGFWDVDTVTDTLVWPARVKAMFGISSDVAVSMVDFYDGLHPEDRERVSAAYAGAADPSRRELYDVEYRTVGKEDGVIRWVAAKGRGLFDSEGRCVRLIGTAIDISARKGAEERLRKSEASLAESVATLDALLAHAPVGFAFFDLQHRYVRLNEVLARINGLPVGAHLGRTLEEVTPANTVTIAPLLDQVARTGLVEEGVEIDGETPANPGERRSWLTSYFPVFGAYGEVAYVGVTAIDITERRRAENAVRELNEGLEVKVEARTAERDRLWRNSQDLQLIVDTRGIIRAVNPAVATILGWTADEMLARETFDFIVEEDIESTQIARKQVMTQALPRFENRYRRKEGGYRWIAWVAAREEELIYASGRDVTAEKEQAAALARAEDALRQAQKMEAVGQLTGGIAHDFNNLLQGVAGSLDLIRRKPDGAQRVKMWAEAGLQAAERGAKLTAQLLSFSRSQKLELRPVAVSKLVFVMRDLLDRTLGAGVRVTIDVETDGLRVLCDETQLEMAVLNLAINARDAMQGKGELTISTRYRTVSNDPELSSGDYVELAVSDTGGGMPPEVLARAFDPFFTTKGIGKGTGLGLSQVYGMVRQAGGTARIESRVGAGTTVRLFLRRTEEGMPAENAQPLIGPGIVPSSATVLVVDDDPDVRRFLTAALTALGYRTLEAEDGYAGIAALDRSGPDAIIVDFAMPGMTGAEVAHQARLRKPGIPIIFASGFAETDAIVEAVGHNTPILRKPFRVDELHEILAAALINSSQNIFRIVR